jgi:hypothetical protein
MDKFNAMSVVIGIATRWGENAEEAFFRRVKADDDDEACREIAAASDMEEEDVLDVRDLWLAIDFLLKTGEANFTAESPPKGP